ncbi:hypothetical protein EPO05_06990, partial [Patescibacteria group bacterium]
MDVLEYLRLAQTLPARDPESFPTHAGVMLVTNFTDGVFQKILTGMCVQEGIRPTVKAVGYKQYPFDFKNPASELRTVDSTVTCLFFDASTVRSNEFSDPSHVGEVLDDLRQFCAGKSGTVFLNTMILPYRNAHGHLFRDHALFRAVER